MIKKKNNKLKSEFDDDLIWVEKYRPGKFSKLNLKEEHFNKITDFVKNYRKQKKKALLFHGLPGTGKTTAALAISKEFDLELMELNSSDYRDKESIVQILGNAVRQMSLFGKGKLILIDEVDGLSGYDDRGGIEAITEIIEVSPYPIILTANDPWNKKFSSIRKKSDLIEFRQVEDEDVVRILREIANDEKLLIKDDVLMVIARKANGDIRAAINDLESISDEGKEITMDDVNEIDERMIQRNVFSVLDIIFKTKSIGTIQEVFDDLEMPLDEFHLWVEENLPIYYKGEELDNALHSLALADKYKRRIMRRQSWRLLKYQIFFTTCGVALSKEKNKSGFMKFKTPEKALRIWLARNKYYEKLEKVKKFEFHSSLRKIMRYDYDLLLRRIPL